MIQKWFCVKLGLILHEKLLLSLVNIFCSYLQYKYNAKGRHGLHSPFVYELMDRCFQQKLPSAYLEVREKYTAAIKNDQRVLSVVDAGAGSKYFDQERKVAQIYRISASKGKYSNLLYRLAAHYEPKNILELGTSLGSGTIALATGNKDAAVHTVEACPQTMAIAAEQFLRLDLQNIHCHAAKFADFLQSYTGEPFDLVFVDGHHDGDALKTYIDILKAHTHDETFFVLDDIRWSQGMKKAYDELINSSDFHVSIDLFRVGILLPRKTQVKEHFVLKLPR